MSVDWDEVHRRLESAAEALERGAAPSEEKRRSILKERSRALSREPERAGTGESIDLVEFRLASESYAIEDVFVREVHPLKDITPLPGTPPFVLGIANLRGQIISVVDLRVFFNLPPRGLGDLNKVIVIRDDRMEFGILADEVTGVRTIPRIGIQPPIPTLSGIGSEYLIGITDEGMPVLDAKTILRDERIVVHQEGDI